MEMSRMVDKESSKPKPAPPPPKVDPRLITFAEKAKKSHKVK
jgi:hypothetical protein